VSAP
jgi:hypothetical protein